MTRTLSRSRTESFLLKEQNSSAQPPDFEEGVNINVNKLRVHYFFTEGESPEAFLDNTEIELRVTDGREWSNALAVGSIRPFRYFTAAAACGPQGRVQIQALQVHLFSRTMKNFFINLTAGLKRDQEITAERLALYKHNGVYFPDNAYYNCDPLPVEWLELFESPEVLRYALSREDDENVSTSFTPFCSSRELDFGAPLAPIRKPAAPKL